MVSEGVLEAACRAMCKANEEDPDGDLLLHQGGDRPPIKKPWWQYYKMDAGAALSAVAPLIRAAALEEAAKVADQEAADWTAEHESAQKQTGTFGILSGVLSAAATNRAAGARDVASAIRALREG